MRVSRQAISKTLREMQSLGLIALENDPARANQKLVVMTAEGMRLATDARRELADIETQLADRIGRQEAEALRSILETGWGDAPTEPSGEGP
jgi:DNA-binding MarR family transcriptional regulator